MNQNRMLKMKARLIAVGWLIGIVLIGILIKCL